MSRSEVVLYIAVLCNAASSVWRTVRVEQQHRANKRGNLCP